MNTERAVVLLERIAKYDHQQSAQNALRYYLPTKNRPAVEEVLLAVAQTDMQAWAREALEALNQEPQDVSGKGRI